MSCPDPPAFDPLSPDEFAARQKFLARRRRRREEHECSLPYVPVSTMPCADGNGDVVVVQDEFTMPETHDDYREAGRSRRSRAVPSTADARARLRRYQSPDAQKEITRRPHARPSSLAVVGGFIKQGRPTAEHAPDSQRPQPRSGEATSGRPLVIVIDTGIAAATLDRDRKKARRTDGWLNRFELAEHDECNIDPLDQIPKPRGLDLAAGHGTFVAGLIAQVAHAARIVMIRAMDTDGIGSEQTVADAIETAGDIFNAEGGGRGILNLSLGFETFDNHEPEVLRAAMADLPPEVLVAAAAGNMPDGRRFWPAASTRALGVAALRDCPDRPPARWSNRGPWVDFSTRGENLVSPFVAGTETKGSGKFGDPFDPKPETFEGPNPFALWTGTSFATAQVSGSLANLLTYDPTLSRADATQRLKSHGSYHRDFGYRLSIL